MKYSYKLISEYIDGVISPEKLIRYLEILGLNPLVVEKDKDDIVFDLETPANRGDLLSLIGVAREILPFTSASIKLPPLVFKETSNRIVPVKIEDKDDCIYYSCRVIEKVSVKETDIYIKEKIEKLGYRSNLNVIDISNYVMAEIGQPLHIFDLDKIDGFIEVRRGRKGESLVTIDGKKREIDENVLVIADSKKTIAIAGIMGGQNSEVTADTKNILIESAIFNPVVVRRGSKKIGLATEASARFERGISTDICKMGMSRTAFLIQEISRGDIGPLSESGRNKETLLPVVRFDMAKVNKFSGVEIEEEFVLDLLKRLNFKVKKEKKSFVVSPPSYRNDIKEDVDIIEEIVRYRHYETIPPSMPFTSINPTPCSPEVETLEKIRDICVQLGFTEVVHMGLTSGENVNFNREIIPVEIENPISSNLKFLRTSLIPEMLETIRFNIYHGARSFNLFEIGKVYSRKKDSFEEDIVLSFMSINSGDFFILKGKLEKLFDKLNLKNIQFKKQSGIFSTDNNLTIYLGASEFQSDAGLGAERGKQSGCPRGVTGSDSDRQRGVSPYGSNRESDYLDDIFIGNIFILSDEIKDKFDIRKFEICGSEIVLEKIIEKASFVKFFKEPSKYPSSRRDFSFFFPENIEWGEIENTILSLNLPVEKIECFDFYKADNMTDNTISISFSVFFRSDTGTLENEDVVNFSEKIIEIISLKLKGKLRGAGGET
ncbi:MAG: phenylalanine--tRNA ligase subunit beta [Candidatus Omnitrophica bacterium]|nr:phenylalanine--tRNA ligase subunit beta [Candidatus Omnitrophota bacterium]